MLQGDSLVALRQLWTAVTGQLASTAFISWHPSRPRRREPQSMPANEGWSNVVDRDSNDQCLAPLHDRALFVHLRYNHRAFSYPQFILIHASEKRRLYGRHL